MCDPISAQASVLEHNISTDIALRHKRATAESVHVLTDAISRMLPELNAEAAYHMVAVALLMTSAAWPHNQPSEALLAAYASDPAITPSQTDFATFVTETLELTILGLNTRNA